MGPADCIRRAHLISCLPTCPRSTNCSHPCHRMQRKTLDGHQCAINDHHLLMKRTDGRGDPQEFHEVDRRLVWIGDDLLTALLKPLAKLRANEHRSDSAIRILRFLQSLHQMSSLLLLNPHLSLPAMLGPLHRPQSKTRPGDPENP